MNAAPPLNPAVAWTIHAPRLQQWATELLSRCGVAADAAHVTAAALVKTSLRGIDTHGIARLPAYVQLLADGGYRADAQPRTTSRHGSLHCAGDAALGPHAFAIALRATLDLARTQSFAVCTIDDCGHLGALGTLLLGVADAGMAGFLCQRTPPIMALPGYQGRAIGNNPLAFAMPVAGAAPLVFDIALSQVARGHIADAAREKQVSIPPDWALDRHGNPTTDPHAALDGSILPLAGTKGLGLAMLVQCLAGSLGEPPADSTRNPATIGAFLLVANPELLAGRAAFEAQVSQWLASFTSAAGPAGRYPGQRAADCERVRTRTGIPLDAGLVAQLQGIGNELRLPLPATNPDGEAGRSGSIG